MDGPDERYEKIPWERLAPGDGPSRRWLGMVAGAVVVVAVVAFLAGSRGPVPEPVAAAVPPPTDVTSTTMAPAPLPLPSEADLRAPDAAGTEGALAAFLAEAWSGPGIWVDRVSVEPANDGAHRAVVSLLEVVDGSYRRADPLAFDISIRDEGGRLVVETMVPAIVPEVLVPSPAGEVGDLPDPVREALVTAVAPWPGAEIVRAGSDAGRWWAEVAVELANGTVVTTVVWPDLDLGLGSGG